MVIEINFKLLDCCCFRGVTDPIYKAIWADNKSFDEVLISKRMVQDHMPDNVLGALEKVSFCFVLFCLVYMDAFPGEGSGYPIRDFASRPGTEQTFLLP